MFDSVPLTSTNSIASAMVVVVGSAPFPTTALNSVSCRDVQLFLQLVMTSLKTLFVVFHTELSTHRTLFQFHCSSFSHMVLV